MNLDRISNLTSSLNTRPSRRDVMRGLMVTGLGLAALQLPDAGEAKKRKKRKKRKKVDNGQTCEPGTSIGSVRVPATGADVRTAVLAEGQRYFVRTSGYWYTNATHGNDAFASFALNNHGDPITVFQEVRLGLLVDGGSPDEWGNYNFTHNYEREVVGQGKSLKLQYTDPKTNDNSGSMIVDIVCA